jgi:hypothetical protein
MRASSTGSILCSALLAMLTAGACSLARRETAKSVAPPPAPSPAQSARLPLDPELSPVKFRWLSPDAVFVAADIDPRDLAGFGNYIGRAASGRPQVELSVWDDEAAWLRANSAPASSEQALTHKRAEFVRDTSGSSPVDRFLVFSPAGEVLYQRDFRAYPLSELD